MFLGIYLVLFTPKVTIHVTDRLNPALPAATIDNVPYGLAAFASMTSEVGDGLTRLMESSFALPDDMTYQQGGMLFGARLLRDATGWEITNSTFASNMTRMARQCLFYGVLLGQISLDDLKAAPDLWGFIATHASSDLRHFEYEEDLPDGGRMGRILSCREGIAALGRQWGNELDQAITIFGSRLFPHAPAHIARAEFVSRLPIAHDYLIGASRDAGAIMQQQMLINALDASTRNWAAELGNDAALQGYQQARADLQTRAVYQTTALQAEKWVPILKIVFESLYYGAFPLALIMMLTPVGLMVLRGYFGGFVWLQTQGPLYAILHRIMMGETAASTGGLIGSGETVSIVTRLGVQSVIADASAMAGYLSMSVPFLAFGLMFGAGRFAQLATSMLAPSQRAAGVAAEEATSGNISLSNTNMDTHSFNTQRGHSVQTSAFMDQGMVTSRLEDGALHHRTADGGQSISKDRAFSDAGFNVSWGSRISEGLQTRASEAESHALTQAERASTSLGSAYSDSLAFGRALQNSSSMGAGHNRETRDQAISASSRIEQAAERLSEQTGWSQNQSLRALAQADASKGFQVFGMGAKASIMGSYGAQGTSSDQWDKVESVAKEFGTRESFETLRSASQSLSYSSSTSDPADLRDSISASYQESRAAEESMNESLTRSEAYETARTSYEESSASFNANLNQQAMEIGAETFDGDMAEAYRAAKGDPALAQTWADEAAERYIDQAVPESAAPLSAVPLSASTEGLMDRASADMRSDHDFGAALIRDEANLDPDYIRSQIDERHHSLTAHQERFGGQVRNTTFGIGSDISEERNTTGARAEVRSDQNVIQGSLRALDDHTDGTLTSAMDKVRDLFGDNADEKVQEVQETPQQEKPSHKGRPDSLGGGRQPR